MKQLIVTMAAMTLMLALLMEMVHLQMLHSRMVAIDSQVRVFEDVVRQEGRISVENEGRLREKVGEILGTDHPTVEIAGTRQPVPPGQELTFQVMIPLDTLLQDRLFWGVTEEEDRFHYQTTRSVISQPAEAPKSNVTTKEDENRGELP